MEASNAGAVFKIGLERLTERLMRWLLTQMLLSQMLSVRANRQRLLLPFPASVASLCTKGVG